MTSMAIPLSIVAALRIALASRALAHRVPRLRRRRARR
jgi:hypothetical protein